MVVYWDLGSPDSIGPILLHHKDLAERLRCDLRAKQQGELCERVGEQNLLTNLCQESTGKGVGRGMCAMLDATGVVERDRTSWSGVGAPSMNIGWVVPLRES